MLYLMVAGRKPFYGSRDEVLAAHRNATPPLPSDSARVSPELEAVILKSLAKDPDERYQTGAEFAQALAEIDVTAPPPKSFASRILGLYSIRRVATVGTGLRPVPTIMISDRSTEAVFIYRASPTTLETEP